MDRRLRRPRRLWNALACAVLASGLAACGGGGGGASSGPPGEGGSSSGGGGSQPESAYLLAEFVAQDSNHQFVRVWDPAQPGVAVENIQVVESDGIVWTASHLVFSDATSYDPATRTVATLGHAKVFFDNDGKVYSIDLRGGQSHAPVQLSSVEDAATIVGAFPMDAAGDDAWVDVHGGGHDWAVRATMASTDAAFDILSIRGAMRGDDGLPQYFLVSLGIQEGSTVEPTTFEVRSAADFGAVADADVATMGNEDDWLGADPAQPGLAYLRIGGLMRALRWDSGGVSVDAGSLYAFGFTFVGSVAVVGADALYVADEKSIVGVADGHAAVVGQTTYWPQALVDAGGYVAVYESNPQTTGCCYVVEGLSKATGAVQQLGAGDTSLVLVGATADRIIVAAPASAGASPGFTLVAGDGSGAAGVAGEWVGVVRADTAGLDQASAPVALLTCAADPVDAGFCGPGALTQVDIASGTATTLGSLAPASVWMQSPTTSATVGLPFSLAGQTFLGPVAGFSTDATDRRDAWQFTPAAASSLARVTDNVD